MHDLNDLYFFAKVAEHGGFMAAARQIGVPKSRLSRRVAELEAQLGAPLFERRNSVRMWAGHLEAPYTLKKVVGHLMQAPLYPVSL